MDFAVDAGKMFEFVMWLHNQLLLAGFKYLVYIQAEAFKAFSQLLFMFIAQDSDVGKRLLAATQDINIAYESALRAIEQAKTRSQIVHRIQSQQHWLLYATPETKGMLLYQITRHSMASHFRISGLPSPAGSGIGQDTQMHYLDDHKKAVITILSSVQLIAEWNNVMQHMTRDGSKAAGQEREHELHVIRFLNYGLSLADDEVVNWVIRGRDGAVAMPRKTGNVYLDRYVELRSNLMLTFPKGYQVAFQGTAQWLLYAPKDGRVHPEFGLARLNRDWSDIEGDGEGLANTA